MSAHLLTSLNPCFTQLGTYDGAGKQGLVRHSQPLPRPVHESHQSKYRSIERPDAHPGAPSQQGKPGESGRMRRKSTLVQSKNSTVNVPVSLRCGGIFCLIWRNFYLLWRKFHLALRNFYLAWRKFFLVWRNFRLTWRNVCLSGGFLPGLVGFRLVWWGVCFYLAWWAF